MRRARTDRRHAQSGVSFVFMLFVLLAIITAIVAGRVVSRWSDATINQAQTNANLKKVAAALEQYVATATRLPCPADPTQDTGLEVPGANTYSCGFDTGTVPWATIGLRRDDSFDGWGWKISYRVYDQPGGSLVQPGGASMVLCDTVEPFPSAPTSGPAGGQCQATKDTPPSAFLAGKGLTVHDYGVTHNDAAYVLISHGPTGYGAYTTSGLQKPMPKGNELSNTHATGPFYSQAWSQPDIGVSDGTHFDDVVFYRSVADLAKNANLAARDWPESAVNDVLLNTANVSTALGHAAAYGDLSTTNLGFTTAGLGTTTITAYTGSTPTDLTLESSGGNDGVGVAGFALNLLTLSIVSNMLTSAGNEYVHIALPRPAQQFAVTLDNFGTNKSGGITYTERAQLTFRRLGVAVASVIVSGCKSDGGLASFAVNPGAVTTVAFDSVDLTPLSTAEASWEPSFFLLSEIASCDAGTTCTTTLASGSNNCTAPAVTPISASVVSTTKALSATSGPSPSASPITVTLSYTNVGTAAASSVTLTDAIPSGMTYVTGSGLWSQSGTSALTDASDGVEQGGIDYSYNASTGTVTAVISSVAAGASGTVTFQVNIASGLAPQTLNNVAAFASSTQSSNNTNTASYFIPPPLDVTKSLSPTTGASPSASAITVTLTYANSGTSAASSVTLVDTLPSGMTYVANSGQWSVSGTNALTDASDGIEQGGIAYSYNAPTHTVTAVISSVASGDTGNVTFQVNVASGLAHGAVVGNQATFSTSTQSSTTTNSATYTVQ